MTRRKLIPLTSPDQVPKTMTEAEAREFWGTHEITEEYLASAPPVPADALPPFRQPSKYQTVHLRREVFEKLRGLARQRGIRVDDLIDDLVSRELAGDEERRRITGS